MATSVLLLQVILCKILKIVVRVMSHACIMLNFFYIMLMLTMFLLSASVLANITTNKEDILKMFHQTDYEMKFERFEATSYDKNYLERYEVITFKHNRTCTAFNFTFVFKVDFEMNMEMITQAYRFASNEYRLFPMRFEVNLCDLFAKSVFGVNASTVLKCGNVSQCPFRKGVNYFLCNFTPDPSTFPPLIPTGRYMYEVQVMYKSSNVAFVMRCFLEIMRPFALK